MLGGLLLALLAAGLGAALAEATRWIEAEATAPSRFRRAGLRAAYGAAVYLLLVHPLWRVLDASAFYHRTTSLGVGFAAALFVAAFAGALPSAAARALFSAAPHARHLSALSGRPALLHAARIAVVEAAERLVPL